MTCLKKVRNIGFLYNNCMLKNVQENYISKKNTYLLKAIISLYLGCGKCHSIL